MHVKVASDICKKTLITKMLIIVEQAPEVAEGEPIEEENHTNLFTDVLKATCFWSL